MASAGARGLPSQIKPNDSSGPTFYAAHIESRMLSSGRRFVDRTGVGHTWLVGRLVLGHTVRQEGAGGVDRSLSRQCW